MKEYNIKISKTSLELFLITAQQRLNKTIEKKPDKYFKTPDYTRELKKLSSDFIKSFSQS